MWFNKKLKLRVAELEQQVFTLERELFEITSFEKICSEKLKVWVTKHDELLVKHKELLKSLNK